MSRSKKKSVKSPVKVAGDPNATYEKTENHEGPGRQPASVGWSTDPSRFNKFQFILRYPHDAKAGEGRLMTSSWAEPYAARAFLRYVIGDTEPEWTAYNKLVTSTGIEVSCAVPENRKDENELEFVLHYKRTKAEQAFVLPEKDKKSVDLMLRPYPDVEKRTIGAAKTERASSRKPDGKYITVADICEELGVQPRDGRAALRKAKFDKPDFGWQFIAGSDEFKAAKKIIQKGTK